MSQQIAVRIPDETLESLDGLVARGTFANRADAVRAGIEKLVADAERDRIDRAIVEGYTRIPDTELDAWAEASTRAMIAAEPW